MLKHAPLALKWMLSLTLTVLVAVGGVALLVNHAVGQRFADYVSLSMRPRMMTLAPDLADYYTAHGGWDGVDQFLTEDWLRGPVNGNGYGHGMGPGGMGPGGMAYMGGQDTGVILASTQGIVLVDTSGHYAGGRLGPSILARSQPITVDGQTVGYLLAANGPR